MRQRLSETLQAAATDALDQRVKPVEALADDAAQVAAACHAMAIRFHRGGKLVCFGSGGPSTDAQHIAVEFVHPVIVGKRALPAISLTGDVATLTSVAAREGYAEVYAHQLRHLAAPDDIALGVSVDGDDPAVLRGLEVAAELGLLTIALVGLFASLCGWVRGQVGRRSGRSSRSGSACCGTRERGACWPAPAS
jgi:D-sedoheptulose 7-phosphate isomerase